MNQPLNIDLAYLQRKAENLAAKLSPEQADEYRKRLRTIKAYYVDSVRHVMEKFAPARSE